ncbi:NUP [Symbiodinium necroappetens]|uniref:NUP protein n=1 Tax=Symbiodinium necroappetens TaxID=1628268 RepID=A0A813BKP5_9DINO|nr:NUP [Symbiodinium necroappetens]
MAVFLPMLAAAAANEHQVLVPRVVVVTAFPPELARWKARLPLDDELPFPGGAGLQSLAWNGSLQVLAMVTGMSSKNASLSVTALGYDPRFDLTAATWLLAGIAGVDPMFGTVGGVAWMQRLVDGTVAKYLNEKDMPQDWETGWIPTNRDRPYGLPPQSPGARAGSVKLLAPSLVQWAHSITQFLKLPDLEEFQRVRRHYAPCCAAAAQAPSVEMGDLLATDVFWTGPTQASWARNWTSYWLPAGGDVWDRKGVFAMSAMEDFATAEAIDALHRSGRSRGLEALLVLRAASNFVQPWPGHSTGASMDFFLEPACEAAFLVGSEVVQKLVSAGAPRTCPALLNSTAADCLMEHSETID